MLDRHSQPHSHSRARRKVILVGDVMLGSMVNERLRDVGPNYVWGDTKALFRSGDWRACNLECVLSDKGRPWSQTHKVFHFRSDARNVAVLKDAGIDAVSVANNHTLDFEYDAMLEMVSLLDRAGIRHAGAGVNLADGTRPVICNVKGTSIGLIAFTDNEPEWEAGAQRPGLFYLLIDLTDERAKLLLATVHQTRKLADLAIVSAHWGSNWGYEPLAAHVRFAHALIDAGADIIFGHSGHVFQGVELYKHRSIIYCTGNFIDDYAVDEVVRNDESFVFTLEMNGARLSRMVLHPTVIADCHARLA
jgi:poly-gamma-glutamate capsule biosynthesis protein CapA/YwtB (metallophosphatase superfamily)